MPEFCKLHMIITAQEVERGNAYEMVNSDHMEGFEDKHETAAPDVFHHETDGTGDFPYDFAESCGLPPASCLLRPYFLFPLPCILLVPQLSPPWIQIPKIPSDMPSPENEKVHPQITRFGCKPATRAALKSVACAVFDLSAVRRIRFSDGRDEKKKRKTKQENVSIRQ